MGRNCKGFEDIVSGSLMALKEAADEGFKESEENFLEKRKGDPYSIVEKNLAKRCGQQEMYLMASWFGLRRFLSGMLKVPVELF